MSDAMERNCDTCGHYNEIVSCYQVVGSCDGFSKHRFIEELRPGLITFVDLIKEALPKEKKFSLDKLIDDHWKYNEGLVKLCFPYGVDGWETDDILRLVEFAYKQSGKHFWKHCKEHYNIEEEE